MKRSMNKPEKLADYLETLLEERKCGGRRLSYDASNAFSEPAKDRRSGKDRRQHPRSM